MKTALYVAATARTYRRAIDDYFESPEKYQANMEWYKEEIRKCTTRNFCTGFWFGKPSYESQIYDNNTYSTDYTYLGVIEEVNEDGEAVIHQKNKFCVGEEIEIMKPDFTNEFVKVESIRSEENGQMDSAPHPKQKVWVKLSGNPSAQDLLRRKEKRGETNES